MHLCDQLLFVIRPSSFPILTSSPEPLYDYMLEQNRESTEGYSKSIVLKIIYKFGKRIVLNK